MDFQNLNSLNVWLNLISGNLLPMTENSSFSLPWRIYRVFVWLFELLNTVTLIMSFFYVSIEKMVADGILVLVITIEAAFIIVRIQTQTSLVHQLIRRMNAVLTIEDHNMRKIVMANLKPLEFPFKFYLVFGVCSIIIWFPSPIILMSQKNIFYYEDFKQPAVYSKQPFSAGIFVLGLLITTICNVYIFLKKISVDIYTTHLIVLLTAQYQYIASKFVLLFRNSDEQDNTSFPDNFKNSSAEEEIKSLCQQHINTIETTLMMKKLLSLNILLLYVNNVFRFCSIGVMIATVSATLFERFLVLMYGAGSMWQFYILCSCFQRLLESTTEITSEAFHEDWYRFNKLIKRIYSFVIYGSHNINLCLSVMERFNLSLPAFMAIINQSYSIALLLLKVN